MPSRNRHKEELKRNPPSKPLHKVGSRAQSSAAKIISLSSTVVDQQMLAPASIENTDTTPETDIPVVLNMPPYVFDFSLYEKIGETKGYDPYSQSRPQPKKELFVPYLFPLSFRRLGGDGSDRW